MKLFGDVYACFFTNASRASTRKERIESKGKRGVVEVSAAAVSSAPSPKNPLWIEDWSLLSQKRLHFFMDAGQTWYYACDHMGALWIYMACLVLVSIFKRMPLPSTSVILSTFSSHNVRQSALKCSYVYLWSHVGPVPVSAIRHKLLHIRMTHRPVCWALAHRKYTELRFWDVPMICKLAFTEIVMLFSFLSSPPQWILWLSLTSSMRNFLIQ